MGLRPGRCYHHLKKKPYTRLSIRRPRKSYVKGVPISKIHQFEVGKDIGFPLTFYIENRTDIQIRSNSLEAARVIATKYLTKKLGENNFFLKILVVPHHILRENSMATGAGADRFSEGMRHSFGKPIGRTARVKGGQKIFLIRTPTNSETVAKEALKRAIDKLPGDCRIVIGDLKS
jgi:large subunit ribosomal protein L10e